MGSPLLSLTCQLETDIHWSLGTSWPQRHIGCVVSGQEPETGGANWPQSDHGMIISGGLHPVKCDTGVWSHVHMCDESSPGLSLVIKLWSVSGVRWRPWEPLVRECSHVTQSVTLSHVSRDGVMHHMALTTPAIMYLSRVMYQGVIITPSSHHHHT